MKTLGKVLALGIGIFWASIMMLFFWNFFFYEIPEKDCVTTSWASPCEP